MTGQDWINLIQANRQNILRQLRSHWRNAPANRKAGVEIRLYLESNGTVTSLTQAEGSNSTLRPRPGLLPMGDSYAMRPGLGVTEDEVLDLVIHNNALHDW